MKTSFKFLVLLIICAGCHSHQKKIPVLQYEKTDVQEAQLYGKVKEVHLSVYLVKDTLEEIHPDPKSLLSQEIKSYSPDGYIKSKFQINNLADTIIEEEYIYEKGRLVRVLKNAADLDKSAKTEIKYSPAGCKETEITYLQDSVLETKSY